MLPSLFVSLFLQHKVCGKAKRMNCAQVNMISPLTHGHTHYSFNRRENKGLESSVLVTHTWACRWLGLLKPRDACWTFSFFFF